MMWRILACALILLASSSAATAEVQHTVEFAIEPQSLDGALAAFGAQSGMQVLYDSRLAASLQSPGVRAQVTAREALAQLLRGTELMPRFTDESSVTLVSAGADSEVIALSTLRVEDELAARQSFERYARIVQIAVRTALEDSEATRDGSYRVTLRLWIDARGLIEDAQIAESTGDTRLDAQIPRQLQSRLLGEVPPAGMPQPVRIRVNVHAFGGANRDAR